jgi:hypothetical protein
LKEWFSFGWDLSAGFFFVLFSSRNFIQKNYFLNSDSDSEQFCCALSQGKITYDWLTEEKIIEATECFVKCFEQENQIIATKVTYEELLEWAQEYVRVRFNDRDSVCLIAKYFEPNCSEFQGASLCSLSLYLTVHTTHTLCSFYALKIFVGDVILIKYFEDLFCFEYLF